MTVIVGNPSRFLLCRQQQVNEYNQQRRGDDKRQYDFHQRNHGALRNALAAAARRSGRTAGRAKRDRRVNNRRSWPAPLETFTGVGVTYACHEETEGERQHDNVEHGKVPVHRGPRTEWTVFAFCQTEVPPGAYDSKKEATATL